MKEFPTVSKSKLFHTGTLKKEDKKENSGLEGGQGLSVSIHPEDWKAIAYLTGEDFSLSKKHNQLLDIHAVKENIELKHRINQIGIDRGWIIPKELYKVSWFDDEIGSEMFMLIDNKEDALEELEMMDMDSDDLIIEEDFNGTKPEFIPQEYFNGKTLKKKKRNKLIM